MIPHSGATMEVQIRDTIITDEYSVMAKTDNLKKIAQKVADSPSSMLNEKKLSNLKLNDVLQKNFMSVKETDNIEKVIKRSKRRKPVAIVVLNSKSQLVGYFSDSDLSYANACQQIVNNILK